MKIYFFITIMLLSLSGYDNNDLKNKICFFDEYKCHFCGQGHSDFCITKLEESFYDSIIKNHLTDESYRESKRLKKIKKNEFYKRFCDLTSKCCNTLLSFFLNASNRPHVGGPYDSFPENYDDDDFN